MCGLLHAKQKNVYNYVVQYLLCKIKSKYALFCDEILRGVSLPWLYWGCFEASSKAAAEIQDLKLE